MGFRLGSFGWEREQSNIGIVLKEDKIYGKMTEQELPETTGDIYR
jgi:hypothetical protein